IGSFWVAGWSGARERLAMTIGPMIGLAALISITLLATAHQLELLTTAAFAMGFGIGIYNVHLVARTMEYPVHGEQRTFAAALSSVRSLGTAFGAATAGVIANAAGLGDATDPMAVGHAVSTVYFFCWIPFGFVVFLTLRFIRVAVPAAPRVAVAAD